MSRFRKALSVFKVSGEDPDLVLSQYQSVASQIPLLYYVLLINTLLLAATHLRTAPVTLTVFLPGLFTMVALLRVAILKRALKQPVCAALALRRLRSINRLGPLLTVFLFAWAWSLSRYGDGFARAHCAFYVSTSMIGCAFCLTYLRSAVLMVTLVVALPLSAVFLSSGQPVMAAIGLNFMLIAACMLLVLRQHYRDFVLLSKSKLELIGRQVETQRLSDENFTLANIDTLTGLANRRGFFRDLETAISATAPAAEGTDVSLAIGLIDLDGLKSANEAFGHCVGDMVLNEVGNRLASLAGPHVNFARLGGDKFGMLVSGISAQGLSELGSEICRSLAEAYRTPLATANLSASLGIAPYTQAAGTTGQLLECADFALHHAKQSLRGGSVLFSPFHQTAIRDAARLDRALLQADLDAEMFMVFQPIFDAELGRTMAFECLARWHSPELGAIEPSLFIKAAERCNLINRLTQVLLCKALEAARSWPEHVQIAFNLSVRDIACDQSMRRLADIVQASGIAPHRIEFEITETAVMRDFEQARQTLSFLRELGVRIALDDFGTGYSSLSYVHRLPLDKIKVDRSFTAEIEQDAACLNIVTTVLDLCRNLKLRCVVEGLERAPQVAILKQLGCSLMQGYFFARPMRLDDLVAYLTVEANNNQPVLYSTERLELPWAV